jgi:phage terminase large subunit
MDRLQIPKRILIVADSARPEMIKDIKNAGYNIIAVDKGKGSVQDQISTVQEYNVYIRGKNIIKEISSYCRKLDK